MEFMKYAFWTFIITYLAAFILLPFFPYLFGKKGVDPMGGKVSYIFTFPLGHPHQDHYVIVHGDSYEECREIMNDTYGTGWEWSFENEEQAQLAAGKHQLTLFAEVRRGIK